MKFGTIGAGKIALAFARSALVCGHEVVLSSRGGPTALWAKVVELGKGASAAPVAEVASLDCVLLAVPWKNVWEVLSGLPAWHGRVLIDATNANTQVDRETVFSELDEMGTSEIVAGFAKGARVVKAFNSIAAVRFNEGSIIGHGSRVILVSGDHEEPKAHVKGLIKDFGFTAIDLGGLVTGGRLQQAGGPLANLDSFVAN